MHHCPNCGQQTITYSFRNIPGKPTIWTSCSNCAFGCRHLYVYLEEHKDLVGEDNFSYCFKDINALLLDYKIVDYFRFHRDLLGLWCDCLHLTDDEQWAKFLEELRNG